MERSIRVAITQGDFNGIGLEVALKSISGEGVTELFTPVLFADMRLVEYARKTLGLELPPVNKIADASEIKDGALNVVALQLDDVNVQPGQATAASGAGAVASLESAVAALQAGEVDVLVTAPISKEAVQSESFRFPGHTEYLQAKAGDEAKAQMILFDDHVKVALVTTHLPIAEIPGAITSERIVDAATSLSRTLTRDFGITRPKIAVLSLNPHCGDGGLLGSEEKETIIPAIEECRKRRLMVFGPYAADGFFGSGTWSNFDGVLAMYHDQGLAPFKTIAGEHGVNFTAGLPFVRTSPDHGTAYDIAWKNEADPTSMREAIYKAIDIFRCRSRYLEASANPLKKQPDKPKGDKNQRQDKHGKPADKSTDKAPEKSSDKAVEKPEEKRVEKPVAKSEKPETNQEPAAPKQED